jgi:hypothetical protein
MMRLRRMRGPKGTALNLESRLKPAAGGVEG